MPEFRADDPTASSVDRDLRNRSEIAVRQVEGHLLIKAARYANQADHHTPIAGEVGRPACPGEIFGDLDDITIRSRRGLISRERDGCGDDRPDEQLSSGRYLR